MNIPTPIKTDERPQVEKLPVLPVGSMAATLARTHELFDHVHALARVVHPMPPNSPTGRSYSWWQGVLDHYRIVLEEGQEPYDLPPYQLLSLYQGLLQEEQERVNLLFNLLDKRLFR